MDIIRGIFSLLGGRIGVTLLAVIITPLLVRILGSAQYGDYAAIISIISLLMIIANAGIVSGLQKYIGQDRENEQWVKQVFGFYFRVGLLLSAGVAVFILIVSSTEFARSVFGFEFITYLYIAAALVIFKQIYRMVRGFLLGYGKEHLSSVVMFLRKLFFGILGVGLAYYGLGVLGVLGGYLIATLIAIVIGAVLIGSDVLKSVFVRTDDSFPSYELMVFNLSTVVLIVFMNSLLYVDILLLRALIGSEQTGYYKGALVLAEFLWIVPIIIQTVLIHSSAELWEKRDINKINRISSKISRYTLWLTVILAIGLGVLADVFVPLYYGAEFTPAVVPLLVLLPGAVFYAVARPILAFGVGKGDLRPLIYGVGMAAAMNLALNIALIPRYGMYGAAVATSFSYGSMFFFQWWASSQIGFTPVRDLRLFRLTTVILVTVPSIYYLTSVIDSSVIALVIVPPVGFLIYLGLSLGTGVIDRSEIAHLFRRSPIPTEQLFR